MEIGKVYLVRDNRDMVWLFRYDSVFSFKTSCSCSVCLDTGSKYGRGYVCHDSSIRDLRLANSNYLAMWNRHFPDDSVAISEPVRLSGDVWFAPSDSLLRVSSSPVLCDSVSTYSSHWRGNASVELIDRWESLYSKFND